MTPFRFCVLLLFLPLASLALAQKPATPATTTSSFVLGDLALKIQKEHNFTPPATLAELDAKMRWLDSPVVDSLVALRKQKESEPAKVSVEEALAMKNDSPEANAKILSACRSWRQRITQVSTPRRRSIVR